MSAPLRHVNRLYGALKEIRREMAHETNFVFRSTVNPVTGQMDWIVEDNNFDYHQEIARSAYADMLHDTERNKKYDKALKSAIDEMHSRGKLANVLDIGTGTGLLSMMALRSGADSVVACEAFKPMADCAQKVIVENGFKDRICLVHKRSTEMTVGIDGDMLHRANILVTEVFDTELIGEGGISTFNHAHKYLLEDDCIVVPSRARMYAQVVESCNIEHWHMLRDIVVKDDQTIIIPKQMNTCSGLPSVHDFQLDQLKNHPDTNNFTAITQALKIFEFDFTGKTLLDKNRSTVVKSRSIAAGRCHGVFMWWDLIMDTKGEVVLSCAPSWHHPDGDDLQWRDHWMQACYYPRNIVTVDNQEQLYIHGYHDEYSLWFDVTKCEVADSSGRPSCHCGAHSAFNHSRLQTLNNQSYHEKYITALRKVLKRDSVCVTVSDGSYLPLIVGKLSTLEVLCLEVNSISRKVLETYITTNNLSSAIKIFDTVDKISSYLNNCKLKVDVIIGEPFFYTSLLPWHNLFYWYCVTALSSVSSHNVTILPRSACIKCVAMQFDDLGKIRAPVGNCEGFNLEIFDRTIEKSSDLVDAVVEPQPLWEYPGTALSNEYDIVSFDFTKNVTELDPVKTITCLEFKTKGKCDGVAFWMDYIIDDDITVSRGLKKPLVVGEKPVWVLDVQQGVHLLKHPFNVHIGAKLTVELEFTPDNGEVKFTFT